MADNILNMTDISDALKDFYLPALRVQLNEKVTPFYNKIIKTKEGVMGTQIVMALRYGRNGGIGNRADDGTLPTPNSRKTDRATWSTKNIFGVMQLTDKTIKASKGQRGAFMSILETEMEDLMMDAKNSINRQLFGDGTGTLTACSGANTSTSIPVDSTQYLEEGMLIDLIDISDSTTVNDSGLEILSVDRSGLTITVDSAPSPATADGDLIVPSGSLNLELTGLKKIFTADNTLYNVDRSSNAWFNANILNMNGALTYTKMQQSIDDAEDRGSEIDFIMCSKGVNRSYLNLLHATKRSNNTIKLEGGHKEYMTFNGIPVIPDRYMLSGEMMFLDSSNFKMYTMGDWEFMQKDGSILKHKSGKAAYEAVLVNYCDLGCDKPAGQTKLYGITES